MRGRGIFEKEIEEFDYFLALFLRKIRIREHVLRISKKRAEEI